MKTLWVKLGIALVVGLGVGISVGIVYAKRTIGLSSGRMSQWAAVGTYAQLANFQFEHADEAHARAALSDFLSFAQRLRTTDYIIDAKGFEVSVARAYLRLAVLDRHSGNTDGYRLDLSRAQDAQGAAGSSHNSVEDLERVVNQLDSRR
jgi:hypothetical protein